MKFCKDCRHYKALGATCCAPQVAVNPVLAMEMREISQFCGLEGRWFETDTSHLTSTAPAVAP